MNPLQLLTGGVGGLDRSIMTLLDGLVGRSPAADTLIVTAVESYMLQGGVLVALLWWAWFSQTGEAGERRRETVLAVLVGLFSAAAVAIVTRDVLPFRPRPFADPTLGFVLPDGYAPGYDSSSLPSGHAVVFVGLTAGLWTISRALGVVALLDTVCIAILGRLYLGLHYPSDVVGGILIALAIVPTVTLLLTRRGALRPVLGWGDRHQALFYALSFLIALETATEFWTTRLMLRILAFGVVSG